MLAVLGPMRSKADPPSEPRVADALLLGLIHGPAELLPVSSSGHTTLLPWFLDLPYARLSGSDRKAIEVALHAGTAAALIAFPPGTETPSPARGRELGMTMLTLAPTALVGLAARRAIRTRLGTPGTIAFGLIMGSVALLAADTSRGQREAQSLTAREALLAGIAQSTSLWPGVSRSTAMIAAARALGFSRGSAARIARDGLVPAALAASALEAWELAGDEHRSGLVAACAVGMAASFASTAKARPLIGMMERGCRLWPFALWRALLAAAAFRRIRSLGKDGVR